MPEPLESERNSIVQELPRPANLPSGSQENAKRARFIVNIFPVFATPFCVHSLCNWQGAHLPVMKNGNVFKKLDEVLGKWNGQQE
jgi:hypothetical protein